MSSTDKALIKTIIEKVLMNPDAQSSEVSVSQCQQPQKSKILIHSVISSLARFIFVKNLHSWLLSMLYCSTVGLNLQPLSHKEPLVQRDEHHLVQSEEKQSGYVCVQFFFFHTILQYMKHRHQSVLSNSCHCAHC